MSTARQGDMVSIHYKLRLDDGRIVCDSVTRGPRVFTIGDGRLNAAVEQAVVGMAAGETRTATIPASETAYRRCKRKVFKLARSRVPAGVEVRAGQDVTIRPKKGQAILTTVTAVSDTEITLAAACPGNGRDLICEIRLLEILYSLEGARGSDARPAEASPMGGAGVAANPSVGDEAQSAAATEGSVRGEPQVLIVDDDPAIRLLLGAALEEEGYAVRTAADGLEGLKALDEALPDIVILDMGMPLMNGRELARHVRGRGDRPVPIVVMTAMEYDRQAAAEICPVKWLRKPFDLDTLLDGIADVLGLAPAGGAR